MYNKRLIAWALDRTRALWLNYKIKSLLYRIETMLGSVACILRLNCCHQSGNSLSTFRELTIRLWFICVKHLCVCVCRPQVFNGCRIRHLYVPLLCIRFVHLFVCMSKVCESWGNVINFSVRNWLGISFLCMYVCDFCCRLHLPVPLCLSRLFCYNMVIASNSQQKQAFVLQWYWC